MTHIVSVLQFDNHWKMKDCRVINIGFNFQQEIEQIQFSSDGNSIICFSQTKSTNIEIYQYGLEQLDIPLSSATVNLALGCQIRTVCVHERGIDIAARKIPRYNIHNYGGYYLPIGDYCGALAKRDRVEISNEEDLPDCLLDVLKTETEFDDCFALCMRVANSVHKCEVVTVVEEEKGFVEVNATLVDSSEGQIYLYDGKMLTTFDRELGPKSRILLTSIQVRDNGFFGIVEYNEKSILMNMNGSTKLLHHIVGLRYSLTFFYLQII